jgi:telomerase reverse transcriptase
MLEKRLRLQRQSEHVLQVDGHLYKQVVGIPQGSIISTLLCTFFYGDLELRKMNFSNDPSCVREKMLNFSPELTSRLAFVEVR